MLDGRIVAIPFIDFRLYPEGLDGAAGSQINGGLTIASAQQIAALLAAGPLAARLQRVP